MKKILFFAFVSFLFLRTGDVKASLGCMDYGMAYEDLSGYCKCMSGYVWGKNIFGEPYCVSGTSMCTEKYGYHSTYNSSEKSCGCSYGYILSKDMFGNLKCTDPDDICYDKFGYGSEANYSGDKCQCKSGYELTEKNGGFECKSCSSKYGLNSSYNYLSKKCECDDGYTLGDGGQCVKKQNNVFFKLNDLNTDEKLAVIRSEYDYRYYLISYGTGCYSSSIKRYLGYNIVVNLGTDFDVDRYDIVVLYDDNEVCDIRSVIKVDSTFKLDSSKDNNVVYTLPVKTVEELSKPTENTIVESESELKYITTKNSIRVRSLPSIKGKMMGLTKPKMKYPLIEDGDSWVKINYNKKEVWIMKNLVTIVK